MPENRHEDLDKTWIARCRAEALQSPLLEPDDREHVLKFLREAEYAKSQKNLEDLKKLISMRYQHSEQTRERRENSAAYDFESDSPGM